MEHWREVIFSILKRDLDKEINLPDDVFNQLMDLINPNVTQKPQDELNDSKRVDWENSGE